MSDQAGLILIVHNFLDYTRACLESLKRATEYPYKLIVVERNSADGTLAYLHSFKIETIAVKEDLSGTRSLNLGLNRFLSDPETGYIGWIHNDMLFYRGWLANLVLELGRAPDIGKLSPSNFRGEPSQYTDEIAAGFMSENRGKSRPGNGCPWLMRREVVGEIGLFDEGYVGHGGYEDWDYNNRLLEKGYRVMITGSSVVWHPGMGIRKYIDPGDAPQKNAAYYASKWGKGARV